MSRPDPDEDLSALLALHFGEGDARERAATRAHAEGCASCRDYLALVSGVERALLAWDDEPPPEGVLEDILRGLPPVRPPARPPLRPSHDARPLFALVPVMAILVAAVWALAGRLAELPFWPQVDGAFPAAGTALPVAAAAVVLLLAGALGTLALAPVLVLDSAGAHAARGGPRRGPW